jgi:glycosyltransferase involved in cell wall biosynthesis
MERCRVGVVIPALNEVETICSVVTEVSQYGIAIVVDDGSTDNTGKVAESAGALVIQTKVNGGYDAALNLGFAHAEKLGCEYIITLDADGQHDPALVRSFIAELDAGADLVIGIRDRRQRFAEHIFAWVAALAWGMRDPLCGAKAYRMDTYQELGHFDSYNSIGTELAIYSAKRGKRIQQMYVQTRERNDASRFGWSISANQKILRALWRGVLLRAVV